MSLSPLPQTLKLWDELLLKNQQPVVAIGGVDAHALNIKQGPVHLVLYPYELHFRSITNHLLIPNPLSGDWQQDKRIIYEALKQGHSFVAYDLPHSTRVFALQSIAKMAPFSWEIASLSAQVSLSKSAYHYARMCVCSRMENSQRAYGPRSSNLSHQRARSLPRRSLSWFSWQASRLDF